MSISPLHKQLQNNGLDSERKSPLTYSTNRIAAELSKLLPEKEDYATEFVDGLLKFAIEVGTSDIHLQPTRDQFEVRYRNNGVLEKLGQFNAGTSTSIVARIKVLSDLLTYVSDVPQEGRIVDPIQSTEVRVSTFPTLHGERVVLRFFGNGRDFLHLDQLGHTPEVTDGIRDTLDETSGAILVTGPAGSGKSTTLFASLRHLVNVNHGNRCLMSLEDPIEVPIEGVSQSQVNIPAGFDLHTGLRSLLRQDPEVIMIGEIRDAVTAEIAIQACLTGHLMMTTFHSDSVATSISRLLDLGIAPYLLRSGIVGIMSQRLLRRLCEQCKTQTHEPSQFFGLPVESAFVPGTCSACNQTGYLGRVIASEFLPLKESGLANAVFDGRDSRAIYRVAVDRGMKSLWERSTELVREGITSPSEVRRVLGVAMRI